MKFKELLSEDAAVIFEIEEFAEYIQLDNVILKASLNRSTEPKSGNEKQNFDGLHGDFAKLFFKTSDYVKKRGRIPKNGEYVYLAKGKFNKRYRVINSEDDLGVTCLTISAYRQNVLRDRNVYNSN